MKQISDQIQVSRKSMFVTVMLALAFGSLGGHCIYTKKYKHIPKFIITSFATVIVPSLLSPHIPFLALFYLLGLIFLAILIVDLVRLANDKYTDGDGSVILHKNERNHYLNLTYHEQFLLSLDGALSVCAAIVLWITFLCHWAYNFKMLYDGILHGISPIF